MDETPEAYAINLAYRLGFEAGQHALATRCEALDGAWKPHNAPTWEQQVATRIAEMETDGRESHVPTYAECIASWGEAA